MRTRHRWSAAALLLGTLGVCTVLARTHSTGQGLPTRIIGGRAYVAVRDLQNVVPVQYDAAAKVVSVRQSTPFIRGSGETPFGGDQPYEYAGLGSVMAVRQVLNAAQQQSLASPSRVLLRYEIVSSGYADVPSTLQNGFPADFKPPFAVTALLYWANPKGPTSTRFQRTTDPTFGAQVTLIAPRFGEAAVEMRRFVTRPAVVRQSAGTASVEPQGWTVVSQSTVTRPTGIASSIPAALYDLSLETVNSDEVRKGEQYPGLK